jgi:hypothetical protein
MTGESVPVVKHVTYNASSAGEDERAGDGLCRRW